MGTNNRQSSSVTSGRLSAILCALLTGVAVTAAGCTDRETSAADIDASSETAEIADRATPDLLAAIGDEQITLADIRARVGEQLDQMENGYLQQRHRLVDETLTEILRDRVLRTEAEKRGMSVSELLEDGAGAGLDVTEVEIAAWYDANQSRMSGRTLDQVRDQIADHLRTTGREQAAKDFEASLNAEYGVVTHLQPFRVVLDNQGAPALGASGATVTLVEFSDFECPFCSSFFPTLKRIEKEYGDRIQVVYRQFPIPSLHPSAFKAAEASLCAYEQGEFWEFHDVLFQEQSRLAVRDLKEKAGRIGLNQDDFDTCLDTGRYVEQVQNDVSAGKTAGVTGTPALFVNGIPIPGGAVPFEKVAEVLDSELDRVESSL